VADAQLHTFPVKDPGDSLDYSWDFTNLLESAEMISAINSATVVGPTTAPPLNIVSSGIVSGGKIVTLQIDGGVSCNKYTVTVNVTTDAGTPRTFERSCILPVDDR
jgi:hypothetical protein